MAGRSVKRKVRRQKLLINFLVLLHAGVMFGINLMIPVAVLSIFYAAMHFHGIVKMKCASKRIVISGILVAFVSVIVCHVKYGQSVIQGMIGIYFIFIYFAYFIFYSYFDKYDNGIKTVMRFVINTATLIAVLAIMQSVFYPYFNIFEYIFRNGRIRIYEIELSFFAEIIAFSCLICGQGSRRMKLQLLVMIFELIFVSQSRGAMIVLAASGMIAIIRKYWRERTLLSFFKLFLLAFAGISGIYLFSRTPYWDFLFSFFDEMREGMGSGATRVNELIYYFAQLRKDPWFGMGILKGGSKLADEVYRLDLWFFIEDCGILGYVFQTGIVGALWLISVFVCVLVKISKLMKGKTAESKVILNSLTMLLIASLVGIANANHIVSRTSILFFCILLAMADVCIKRETEIRT